MKSLAQETGARSFFPTDISQLAGVYDLITQELSNQYAMGYTSKNPRRDGAFRRIVVRVDGVKRADPHALRLPGDEGSQVSLNR